MKFSIRDLLLVTVIVALAVGWWVERRQHGALRQEHQSLKMSHDVLAGTIEEVMDQHGRNQAASGQMMLNPIYTDESASIRTRQLPNSSAPAANPSKP